MSDQIVLFFASSESSKEKIPTILHLAAKFGLKELLAKLIDLPGSAFANSIANSDRQQPADMASKNNHKDVQEMLELFAENVSRPMLLHIAQTAMTLAYCRLQVNVLT